MDTNKRAFNKVSDAANKERRKQIELRREQKEANKVELGLADELKPLAVETSQTGLKVSEVFDDAFVLLIEAEKAVEKLQRANTDLNKPLVDFVKQVSILETKYQKAAKRIDDMERELGVKIPFPADMEDVLSTLQFLQKKEENLRGDVADYRARSKKLGL